MKVGIDRIGAWPATLALDMKDLCEARGHDLADIRDVMMIDERSVNPPWEDPVTMAVNAAQTILTEQDRRDIGLLIVASESGVDQEKPLSTWVQRYLGLRSNVRNFEIKHACYGGTAGVKLAASWIASGTAGKNAKALVVTTDQSRMHLGKPYEFVMGAGASAVLVSAEPRLIELELDRYGVFTHEVSDLTRPTSRVETGNSETSLLSYLEALDGAIEDYVARAGEPVDYEATFRKNIYHVPFGGITLRAHHAALRKFRGGSVPRAEARVSWQERTEPTLAYVRRIGGTYSSSTFLATLALMDRCAELREGDRFSVYSYGSGSCSELYSARVGPDARAAASEAKLPFLLDARRKVSVREYEECERERTCWIDYGDFEPSTNGLGGWYADRYAGKGLLVWKGAQEHYRRYAWS
ncbi:MAG: hydroxymethylglutaryl-CoA synthase family protein [Sandaracinaceae bacterium]|nr:hydroxymethylglutaryl-CoA synthase family protein [Sandaracinaceae bacterium]